MKRLRCNLIYLHQNRSFDAFLFAFVSPVERWELFFAVARAVNVGTEASSVNKFTEEVEKIAAPFIDCLTFPLISRFPLWILKHNVFHAFFIPLNPSCCLSLNALETAVFELFICNISRLLFSCLFFCCHSLHLVEP